MEPTVATVPPGEIKLKNYERYGNIAWKTDMFAHYLVNLAGNLKHIKEVHEKEYSLQWEMSWVR